jgi:hypothetical protein
MKVSGFVTVVLVLLIPAVLMASAEYRCTMSNVEVLDLSPALGEEAEPFKCILFEPLVRKVGTVEAPALPTLSGYSGQKLVLVRLVNRPYLPPGLVESLSGPLCKLGALFFLIEEDFERGCSSTEIDEERVTRERTVRERKEKEDVQTLVALAQSVVDTSQQR